MTTANKKNKHLTLLRMLFLTGFTILISEGCYKDLTDFNKFTVDEFKYDVAVPLVHAHLKLGDLLGEYADYIIEDPSTRFLTFIYEKKEIYSETASTFIKLSDQQFLFDHWFDYIPGAPGSVFIEEYTSTQSFQLDIPSQRFDELLFKDGYIDLTLESFVDKESILRIELPDVIDLNSLQPLVLTYPFVYQGTLPVTQHIILPLNQYKVVFAQLPDKPNAITMNLRLDITADMNPSQDSYMIRTDLKFVNVKFLQLTGYFGNYTNGITDSIDIDVINKWLSGNFAIDPSSINAEVNVRNSLGVPFSVTIDPFRALSANHPPLDIFLFGQGNPNQFLVQAPDISQIGQTVSTTLVTQSNLAAAINNLPNRIDIGLNATSNPDADTTVVNFVLDTSRIAIDLKVFAGLYGKIDRFILQDTFAFELDDVDFIESLELKTRILNGFPFEVSAQFYLADENYQVIDSLITQGNPIIPAAPVSGPPSYKVTQPAEGSITFMLSPAKINRLFDSRHIIVKSEISTTNRDWVKIYSDYSVAIKLAARIKLSIQP